AQTVEKWWPEILAFLQTGITNAGTEGTNRLVKQGSWAASLASSVAGKCGWASLVSR
ncbi:transposase, partial [Mycobacterium sp.]|uniref:transposase n=1 Tax=Mycobacterium sp. TaxID=1785 RepID=UPI003C77E1A1